ncbi:MAG: hypothetical protein KatS3mg009_1448 [Acidimicrobiia bacterium]|nr:MAG: hypothetical protein KatS3mg009_1448 [Acidimicrobiia bacterium]
MHRPVRDELLPRGRRRRGAGVVRGRWGRGREGGRGDRRVPADAGPADPGRPVRAGEDRDPDRHGPRPAPRRLDRPDDPRTRGRPQRGGVGPQSRRDRDLRRARPAAGELPQGDRGIRLARRAGLCRDPRPDDLRQLPHVAAARGRRRRPRDRLDRRAPVRERLLLHGRERRHPDRGRDVRELAVAARPEEGRDVLGGRLLGPRLRGLLPRRGDPPRPHDHPRGEARAQPAQPEGAPRRDARHGHRGHLLRRVRVRDVPLRGGLPGPRLGTRRA